MSARITKAIIFVADAFKDKKRKGTNNPYIVHLVGTMELVGRYGGTEDEMIAALLHDYLEDIKGAEPWAIEDVFGTDVAKIVLVLTDAFAGSRGLVTWRARKESYIDGLRGSTPSVRLVCAADKINNLDATLRDYEMIGDVVWEKFAPSPSELVSYHRNVLDTLRFDGWDHPIAVEYECVTNALERIVTSGTNRTAPESDEGKSRRLSQMGVD